MKAYSTSIIVALLFLLGSIGTADAQNETLKVISSPELMELTSHWAAAYEQEHPGQNIEVAQLTGEPKTNKNALWVLTSSEKAGISEKPVWEMVIGHDVVVPVIHARNPFRETLAKQGLSAEDFTKMVAQGADWSSVVENAPPKNFSFYVTDDKLVQTKIKEYTGAASESLHTMKTVAAGELLASIAADKYAVGFCKLVDVLGKDKNVLAENIAILPVDKNGNNRIDGFENIFSDPKKLTRGVWVGKYPRELCCDIYAVSASQPQNELAVDFLSWTINDGQNAIGELGYSNLSTNEKEAGLAALGLAVQTPPSSPPNAGPAGFPWGWVLGIGVVVLLIILFVRGMFKTHKGIQSEDIEMSPALNREIVSSPAGLYYDKKHTWSFMEKDGFVKVGVDDFLQHLIGTVTQVKLKTAGEKVRKGEKIMTIIHEGKQLELYAPVSGTIKTQNESLLSNPSQINTSPYEAGWVYQIEPTNWLRETRFLFMADKFKTWLDEEFARLREFLATSANRNTVVYEHIVLQDGGELTDNVLADLEPEVWEDFQTQFIDESK
jgi:glycine cleavage system H lipoate-binding protein/ABC-type phosphate transport system substrate-binding protein